MKLVPNYVMNVKAPIIKKTDIKLIRKFNNDKKEEVFNNKMIVTWDIETFQENGLVYSYKAGIAYYENNEQKYHIFTGIDCLTKLMKFVEEKIEFFKGKYFYAHNGGKFDMNLLIGEHILKNTNFKINGLKCTELNNAWIEFTLVNGKNEIYFRDSYRLFLCGLSSICEDLKVNHRKLEGVIEHHKVTRLNFMDFDKDHKYLIHDCLGLLECLESFGKSTYNSKKICIYKCLTSASLSKKSFYKNYYDQKNFPLYTLDKKMDEYIRRGYYGGHVECFAIGEINKFVFYYDFTSLYPYEGCKDLPFGFPEYIKASLIDLRSFFGFVQVEVTGTKLMLKGKKPLHCMKDVDGKLIFPYLNKTTLVIFSEEIKLGLKMGYKYKVIDGVRFRKGKFLKKCFEDLFKEKQEANRAGNPAMELCNKIIINSTYGFFGTRVNDRDGVIIGENLYYNDFLDQGKLLGYGKIGGYDLLRVKKDIGIKDINVAVSAAIASYSRMKIHELISDIEALGYKVYYCDTDSIITDCKLNEHPELMKKYQWDKKGDEMGCLKNECIKIVKKYAEKKFVKQYLNDKLKIDGIDNFKLKKKQYEVECIEDSRKYGKEFLIKQTEIDEGELHFDLACVAGCKAYATNKKLHDNAEVEIDKLKGYSQRDLYDFQGVKHEYNLCMNDFKNLIAGGTLEQKQLQISCNKQNMLCEKDSFKIRQSIRDKKFKLQYSKGEELNMEELRRDKFTWVNPKYINNENN